MLKVKTDLSQISITSVSAPRDRVLGSLCWFLSVAIITTVLCLPFLRAIYLLMDEGMLLHGAVRLLDGDRLYADFFEFLPPGGFILTAVWFKIAGISVVSARSLAIVTIVGIACFTFLACLRASRNAPLAALLVIGWVVTSQGHWTWVEHHWFTTLFSMITAWAALAIVDHPHRLRWPLIAGAAAGMAAMVTPTRGAFAMMAVLPAFLRRGQRTTGLIVYLIGCALAPAGLVFYVGSTHALVPAFNDVIRFTAEQYSSIQWIPFTWGDSPQRHPLVYVFPAAALLLAAMFLVGWRISSRGSSIAALRRVRPCRVPRVLPPFRCDPYCFTAC